jgi:hypothetical protein
MATMFTVPAGSTLYIPFDSYAADGASASISGLAVTDIEIYKNGNVTQRASDAGIALLDTDGIDFDGVVGLNGFSIDLSNNTDSGFYSVGAQYWVVVSSVTVAGEVVSFTAAWFRIVEAEATAGRVMATAAAISDAAGVRAAVGLASANLDAQLDAIDNAVDTEIATLVTNVGTILAAVDTEVAAIKAKTDNLPSDPADASDIATAFSGVNTKLDTIDDFLDIEVAAIKVVTDKLDDTLEDEGGGNYRFTANALEQAPSGGGGGGLDAAGVRAAIGLASPNLDAQLTAIDNAVDTEIATLVTNVGTILAAVDTEVAAIKAKTDNLPAVPASQADVTGLLTTVLADAYAANGQAPTLQQCLMAIQQRLTQFDISGQSLTVRRLNGTTPAFVITLNSASAPTASARTP